MSLLDASSKDYPVYEDPDAALLQTDTSLAKIVRLIPPGSAVLDVGCASGYVAQLLRPKNCIVTGIEVNESAAAVARPHSAEVIVADLEKESLAKIVKRQKFDVIVFADILEHLRSPGEVLKSAHGLLKSGGVVLASIPNIAHGAIRLALLTGNFDYTEFGILDDSHLRFFTARSIDELFLSTGYRIDQVDRFRVPLFSDSNLVPHVEEADFAPEVVEAVRRDPEHDTLQFVVRALPITETARTRELAKRFLSANTELARVVAALRRRESEVVRANARIVELEKQFTEASDALAARDADIERASAELTELSRQLSETRSAYQERDAEAAQAHAALRARNADIERASAELTELSRQLLETRAEYQKRSAEAGEARARAAELEGKVAETTIALSDAYDVLRDGHDEMVKVQAAMQELEKQYTAMSDALYTANSEMHTAQSAYRERDADLSVARAHIEEIEKERARLENELGSAQRAAGQIQDQLEDTQRRLLDQTDAFLATTRAENERLALLIDTVQSSSFWKMKRVFGRLRGALFG